MPIFEVQQNGKTFEVDAPSLRAALTAVRRMGTPEPDFKMTVTPSREERAIAKLDDVVLGVPMPPIGGAINAAGGLLNRAWGATKAVAAPVAKYEGTRAVLEGLGVPPAISVPAAVVVSGYRRGRGPYPAPGAPTASAPAPVPEPHVPARATGTQWGHVNPASVAAPALPAASPRAVPAPPAGPVAPPSASARAGGSAPSPGQAWGTQRIRNEVGLAERRQGLRLTEMQREQADRLVAQGKTPVEAVQFVAGPGASAPTTTVAAPVKPPAAGVKARMSAAEVKEYQRMIQMGKTPKEAQDAIELQRSFAQQFGTPSPEKVRQKVAERNATGRWRKDD